MGTSFALLVAFSLHLVGCNAQKLKLFTFGDSTIDNSGCFGNFILGGSSYYNWPRVTNNLMWVDYLAQIYEDQIDIQSCTCAGSLASTDQTYDLRGTGEETFRLGLVSQIELCPLDYDQNDNTVAVIMAGGNDVLLSLLVPSLDPVQPSDFADAFAEAIRKINETGISQIYIVNTIFENNPYVRSLRVDLPLVIPVLENIYASFFMAFDGTIDEMQDLGFPVDSINFDDMIDQIQAEAKRLGINGLDSCFVPVELPGETLLPECETVGERVWFDGIHMADWGQQQLALIFADIFESDGLLDD